MLQKYVFLAKSEGIYFIVFNQKKKKMIIREAQEIDLIQIVDFQLKMALETEKLKLDESILKKGVLQLFGDVSKGKYYVVENKGSVIGSFLITYEWSDWRNSTIIWIQSVYVLVDYRQKGAFRLMYDHIKGVVFDNEKYTGLRLYVDKTNINAQKVYKAVGMTDEHYSMFEWMK